MIKTCKIHGQTDHSVNSKGKTRCKKCAVIAVTKRRRVVKEKAIKYKGGKCIICGYNKHAGALDFHHVNPIEKEFAISSYGHCRSWKRIQKELDKCVLICANCHREVHDGLTTIDISKDKTVIIEDIININKCIDCNVVIDKQATRCVTCSRIVRRIKNRPSKDILLEEIKIFTYTALGKKYSVSDNTIRNWLK